MNEEIHEHRRREDDNDDITFSHYRHEMKLKELELRVNNVEAFNADAQPNIDYIKSVIRKNNERADFYKKTAYNIAGWGFMGIITWIGFIISSVMWPALMTKLRQYLGGF